MATLPRKAQVGDDFKSYTVSAINKIIDYLHAMRLKTSPEISVDETASGVLLSLAKHQTATPQVQSNGGGTEYGLEVTIDGSTASVALVEGGTASSVSIVPTAPVTITGGTNGELIIGSTASGGGGMAWPFYSDFTNRVQVSGGTTYNSGNGGWIAGEVRAVVSGATIGQDSDYNVHITIYDLSQSANTLYSTIVQCYSAIKAVSGSTYYRVFPVVSAPVFIAVPPGYAFQFGSGYSIEGGSLSIDYSGLYFYKN